MDVSRHHHQGGRLCQAERRVHPAAQVRLAGLPDKSGVPPGMRPFAWPLIRISMFGDRNAVSRSSFGGAGQGEEAVALDIPSRWAGGGPRWKRVLDGNRKSQRGPPLPSPLLPRRRGGSTRTSGRRLCQAERQIYPAAPVRLAGLPDESGVPVVVSGCAPCERRRWRVLLAGDNDFCDREHREQTSRMR